ncbi:MAG TPA: hypothetical protein VFI39_07750 [Gemmatimonadales bacterium]|nr:hypothetical protein [Gemmatimonadales bacterium]
MTDRFIPPPPSDEAIEAYSDAYISVLSTRQAAVRIGLNYANAIDQPRVCRAEVAEFIAWYGPPSVSDAVTAYLDDRYGPAPKEPAQHPGIADVVALHQAGNAPHLCDRPETLAFLRGIADWYISPGLKLPTELEEKARAFIAATREAE